ncbi:ribbon-helix-helix domain-containing protein [Accumulibacter sp.]|uniref:ribbon-helix-helix domain-containing protein n=1 Tax=Accumulibacter sp. TaxID=2053492 RepID=UPI00287AE9CD|nr:ribbon-helix-helix domain-containing protein [Accumulibacter sp.]MDS4056044.1 hypothetical protein [Accumulibacter sp.]
MAKPNPLAQGLNQISPRQDARPQPSATESPAPHPRSKVPPSRGGRVLVGGFFTPEVQTALKVIAAEERTTLQALLTEAINTVFAKRGRPEIAGLPPKAEARQ